MTNKNTESVADFLIWFTQQEIIPVSTRRDFLAHVIKNRGLDKTSIAFVETHLKQWLASSERSLENLERENTLYDQALALEKNSDTAQREALLNQSVDLMQNLSNSFSDRFKTYQNQVVQNAESLAQSGEKAEVAALKANLK